MTLLSTSSFVGSSAEIVLPMQPDSARIAHIKEILREVPLIDGHNDLPWEIRQRGGDVSAIDFSKSTSALKLVTDMPRLHEGHVGGQFWSVYIPPTLSGPDAVQAVLEQIDVVHQLIARYPNDLELALTANDIERIHREGKIASMIGMEGGHSINNSLAMLRMMYALGARYMTLTHTKSLDWADAAGDKPKCHGLSPFGEKVVGEMNRLGMLVDLSHVSDETMAAAIKSSKAPIICSHSSARALCDVPRNVPDDLLKQISKNGGVVMVNFVPGFLKSTTKAYSAQVDVEEERLEKIYGKDKPEVQNALDTWRAAHPRPPITLSDVADHMDHIRQVAGIDCLGIGGDFEGFSHPPQGLDDVSFYPSLLAELSRRGYTDEEIKKVAGLNLLRVLRMAEKVSQQLQQTKS